MSVTLEDRAPQKESNLPLRARALAELSEDCDSLIRLVEQRMAALRRLRSGLHHAEIPELVRTETGEAVDNLLEADAASIVRLQGIRSRAAAPNRIDALTGAVRCEAELLRARQARASGLLVAADWHSPSIGHSVHPNAGPHQGEVTLHFDDYKRDRHPDQAAWENLWLSEMVDNPASHPLRALMTASGMAAFTTVLAYVEERAGAGPILMGAGTYHECRDLLSRSHLAHRIITIPESDTAAWRDALEPGPAAVFVDTMCNAPGLAVPDVEWLIDELSDRPVILVLDNTALSVSFQPWRHLPTGSPMRMICFESLTKYPQLGMDRAAGGVIVAPPREGEAMDRLREHLGTNVADVVVYQHPWPDRVLLQRRLARIGRNASLIAETLSQWIARVGSGFRILYPGLSTNQGSRFHGGFLGIETSKADAVGHYRRAISSILEVAAAHRVPICHGTSFGLDTTRVYVTAANARSGTPFLRIAAGHEHVLGARAVTAVIAEALEQVT